MFDFVIVGSRRWIWILCKETTSDIIFRPKLLWRVRQCWCYDECGWNFDVLIPGNLPLQYFRIHVGCLAPKIGRPFSCWLAEFTILKQLKVSCLLKAKYNWFWNEMSDPSNIDILSILSIYIIWYTKIVDMQNSPKFTLIWLLL